MRKSKRTEEPSNQYLEVINNKYCYFGPDYKFTLTDEKYHNYATLVINNHYGIHEYAGQHRNYAAKGRSPRST